MKSKLLLISATLLGGVLSTSAFAATSDVHADVLRGMKFEAPVVAKLTRPTGLSRRFAGTEVTLALTIDAQGRPRDIKLVSGNDRNLRENLIPAVSQWRFTPAKKDGVAVEQKVLLPIQLVESSDS